LQAFRTLCAEISDWQQECARAKAAAAAAQKSLAEINQQVAAATSQLDKLKAERAVVEEKVRELRSVHSELSNDIARIKQMVAA
jgi:chromosome segregation ATPase